MLRYFLCVVLVQTISWAQEGDILGYEIENANTSEPSPPAPIKKNQGNQQTLPTSTTGAGNSGSTGSIAGKPPAGTGNLKIEDYYQSWNARRTRQGISYSPLLNVAQYDRWFSSRWGFFIGFRYQKSTDTFTESKSTTYNPSTLNLSETTSFSGTRSPTSMSLVVGVKNRIWQNDWLQINWGPLLMYTHGTTVNYSVGTVVRTVANVNTPNDYAMTETGVGTVNNGVDPTYSLGVKVGSEFYLKWLPNLSLCADVVILNQLPLKGTQESNTSTRTYNVVAGVAQSPTSESYNTNRVFNDYGGAASTSQVGASYFNLLGTNWSIKYVW